jgi:hypothetical protein
MRVSAAAVTVPHAPVCRSSEQLCSTLASKPVALCCHCCGAAAAAVVVVAVL